MKLLTLRATAQSREEEGEGNAVAMFDILRREQNSR